MSGSMRITKTLDLRGTYCPVPVMETAKAIRDVKIGEIIEVLATDPSAKPDIETWAKKAGQEVIKVEQSGGVIRVLVRRTK
jgi:tRNA 2-thiouridine synthesizing protein A